MSIGESSGFLQRLVSRTRAQDAPVRPRLASRFEPVTDCIDANEVETVESIASARVAVASEVSAAAVEIRTEMRSEPLSSNGPVPATTADAEVHLHASLERARNAAPGRPRDAASLAEPSEAFAMPQPHAGEVVPSVAASPRDTGDDRAMPGSTPAALAASVYPRPTPRRATVHVAALVPVRQPAMIAERHAAPVAPRRSAGRFEPADVEPAATPDVHVTIGRLEVRAIPAGRSARAPHTPARRTMSLDDYLRERGGKR